MAWENKMKREKKRARVKEDMDTSSGREEERQDRRQQNRLCENVFCECKIHKKKRLYMQENLTMRTCLSE